MSLRHEDGFVLIGHGWPDGRSKFLFLVSLSQVCAFHLSLQRLSDQKGMRIRMSSSLALVTFI